MYNIFKIVNHHGLERSAPVQQQLMDLQEHMQLVQEAIDGPSRIPAIAADEPTRVTTTKTETD